MSDAKRPLSQKKKDTTKLDTRPAFRKAKSLFHLRKPDPATEEAWKPYITNRLKASRLHESVIGPDIDDDEEEEEEENANDEYEKKEFEQNREFIDNIDRAMTMVAEEMDLQKHLLSTSYAVMECDVAYGEFFKDEEIRRYAGPECVNIITRIYSPTRPLYIDVHFYYEWLMGYEDIGFRYRIGFKVYPSPAKNDYPSGMSKNLCLTGDPDALYISNGWRPFAHGHSLPDRRPKILNNFTLHGADVQNICAVLWGPQVALLEGADEKTKNERRRLLVNSVRVVLAGAGIESEIACQDNEEDDKFTYWELGQIRKWISCEIRDTCGFRLKRDLGEVSQNAEKTPWPYIESLNQDYEFDYSYDDYEFTHRPFPY